MRDLKHLLLLAFAIINGIGGSHSQKPPLGEGTKVCGNNDSFRKNVKINYKNEEGKWLFRQPSVKVFKDLFIQEQYAPLDSHAIHDGGVSLEMCNSLEDLFRAHFRQFQFEGLEKPWQIFTNGWSDDDTAEYFGIPHRYLNNVNFCYLLVTIQKERDSKQLWGSIEDYKVDDSVATEVNNIDASCDVQTRNRISSFLSDVGSHYIHSYTTGNTLYQVLVYPKSVYNSFTMEPSKDRFVRNLAKDYERTEYHGTIKTASGNRTVEAWAHQHLHVNHYANPFDVLYDYVYWNRTKFQQLSRQLEEEVIVQLNLRSTLPLFKERAQRNCVQEVLDDELNNSMFSGKNPT
ncbi:torso-like protein isoform X1 [Venturia canescens]|uniref:torso-like protein isoform X1 n=1 Tax=Venturia canescens TaxID=32260 RepID=UPI001C9C36AE|nr:torso-like protein isoform X1 [Venturia canescens]